MSHDNNRTASAGVAGLLARPRLRDLIDANANIVEPVDVEVVLRRIVRAAVTLVGARFGALEVVSVTGEPGSSRCPMATINSG